MSLEKWDIYDSSGNITGKTILRGKCLLKPGEYHLVVHIWIVSSNGMFIIQRRSDTKKLMPGEWAATGGAAMSGEDSYTAANRELFEELGIKTDRKTLSFLTRLKRRNSFLDIYATTYDKDIEQLKLQKSEVSETKLVTKSRLKQMIENKEFHNYGKEYFDTVFNKIEEYVAGGVTV